MIHLLLKWLVSAVSLLIVAYVAPGFHVRSFGAAMIAALVIGLVNGTLGAVLRLVTWPLRILTLGLLTWVISAAMILLSFQTCRWLSGGRLLCGINRIAAVSDRKRHSGLHHG